jgi:hypothetical protein
VREKWKEKKEKRSEEKEENEIKKDMYERFRR